MAVTQTRNVGSHANGVLVCSDRNPDDCVGVGVVHQDVVRNVWTIEPATAQVTDEVYATEDAAISALLEREYEYLTQIPTEVVGQPTPLVRKTMEFLRELLTENDD